MSPDIIPAMAGLVGQAVLTEVDEKVSHFVNRKYRLPISNPSCFTTKGLRREIDWLNQPLKAFVDLVVTGPLEEEAKFRWAPVIALNVLQVVFPEHREFLGQAAIVAGVVSSAAFALYHGSQSEINDMYPPIFDLPFMTSNFVHGLYWFYLTSNVFLGGVVGLGCHSFVNALFFVDGVKNKDKYLPVYKTMLEERVRKGLK